MEEEDANSILPSTTSTQVVNITQDAQSPNTTYANTTFVRTEDYFNILLLAAERITPSQMLMLTLTTNQV